MSSSFFLGAKNTRIGQNCMLQHVEGDMIHNYNGCPTCQEQDEDRVMPKQKWYRVIFEGDICLRGQTWSEKMEVMVRAPWTEDGSSWNGEETRIAVVKKFHTATINPDNHTVTAVTLEPKHKRDRNTTRLLWRKFYEAYSAHK
ncbi:hypothetical protein PM082_019793 [Marasmius tenuissimus]|nr:hypothetical protein PM082_019793 [Marasmius tenuissimus]